MSATLPRRLCVIAATVIAIIAFSPVAAHAGEAGLRLPNLNDRSIASFMGMSGWVLLMLGLLVCVGGLAFGLHFYKEVKNLPVHSSMLEISELIYETCKTYLFTQA